MATVGWLIAFLIVFGVLAYQRASLRVWGIGLGLFFVLLSRLGPFSWITVSVFWVLFILVFLFLALPFVRKKCFTGWVLRFYRDVMPTMSRTEREALSAGAGGWGGEFFSGSPHWA